MKLSELPGYLEVRKVVADPELRARLDRFYLPSPDERQVRGMRKFFFYSAVVLYLVVTALTAFLTLAATAKLIEIDSQYLKWLWPTFVAEFVPLVIWVVRQIFKSEKS